MNRVSQTHPCPICKKPDWCLTGQDMVICMRVPSPKAKTMADGSVGYFHKANGAPLPPPIARKREEPFFDSSKLLTQWTLDHGLKSIHYLAKNLGVSQESLEDLRCVKAPDKCVWAFPMRDGYNYVIGIRLRHENGEKWCNPGGHNGLFIPQVPVRPELVICEGPTDTAAALTIGLYAIGRFNCCGGINMIKDFVREKKVKRVVIVADCDQDREVNGQTINPGIQGAMNLAEHLPIPSCTLALPVKDMREFVRRGGNHETFMALANSLVWNIPHAKLDPRRTEGV